MKRFAPLSLLALFLVGCGSSEPAATATEPKPAEPVATKPSGPPPEIPSGINPNRVHQLKDLAKKDLDVKGNKVHAWIMDDDGKREEGMMFLKDEDVKPDEGMLFVFQELQLKTRPGGQSSGFWMQNTLIPLDIIYLSPKGQVINVGHGKRLDETTVLPSGDYRYVLELKAGTAERFGLKPGDTISIPK